MDHRIGVYFPAGCRFLHFYDGSVFVTLPWVNARSVLSWLKPTIVELQTVLAR